MKAIQMNATGEVAVLEIQEVAVPQPKPGELLIKIAAAPVNYIDTIIRRGDMPPGMMPEVPFIPGVEGTGVVETANATGFHKGDNVGFLGVIGSAVYAEYAVVPADKVVLLDSKVDLHAAAVIPVNYVTAYHMMKNVVGVTKGKTALVYAASGGVGTALIQLAKLFGLKIVALERRAEKVSNALALGADYAFNTTDENWVSQVENAIGENAVDYVFNPVAGDSLQQDLQLLAPLGHIVVFGFLGGKGSVDIMDLGMQYFSKAPTLSFSEIYATYFNDYELIATALKQLYLWLASGAITPVYETLPLSKAQEAHQKLEAGKVRGKLILINDF
jgi:NADPH:quinone reductase-like Zn-dependent oxidoreductase